CHGRAAHRAIPGAIHTVERLIEGLYARVQESRGVELLSLRCDGLALGAKVVVRVHDVVMATPTSGANGVVAGPRDAREVCDAAMAKHRAATDEPPQVRDSIGFGCEPVCEFGVRLSVKEQYVHPFRSRPRTVADAR